jgi:hypothetical protein
VRAIRRSGEMSVANTREVHIRAFLSRPTKQVIDPPVLQIWVHESRVWLAGMSNLLDVSLKDPAQASCGGPKTFNEIAGSRQAGEVITLKPLGRFRRNKMACLTYWHVWLAWCLIKGPLELRKKLADRRRTIMGYSLGADRLASL